MKRSPNNARPQRFAIHGEYAVACEGLGSNNAVYACPGDLTDGPSASGVRTRWATGRPARVEGEAVAQPEHFRTVVAHSPGTHREAIEKVTHAKTIYRGHKE